MRLIDNETIEVTALRDVYKYEQVETEHGYSDKYTLVNKDIKYNKIFKLYDIAEVAQAMTDRGFKYSDRCDITLRYNKDPVTVLGRYNELTRIVYGNKDYGNKLGFKYEYNKDNSTRI